jgi:hypothetical protein
MVSAGQKNEAEKRKCDDSCRQSNSVENIK